ncbi:MAG: hypothetical protein ACFFCE_11285 [Promethearchaeota archaeon]
MGDNILIGNFEDNGVFGNNHFTIVLEEEIGYSPNKLDIHNVINMIPVVDYKEILKTITIFMSEVTYLNLEINLNWFIFKS